jgi:glycosyltransferase involved in cell wall biosynthesis
MSKKIKSKKIKIIFISHNFHFLKKIIDNLNQDLYDVSTHHILKLELEGVNTENLLEIIADNQIVWIEWLLKPAILLSKIINKKFKLIIRLHSYEYFHKKHIYISSTNFLNIDKLIIVNDWFRYKLIEKFKVPESMILTLPNLFNIFTNENNSNRQKKLGVVGIKYLTNKGIDKILDIFEKIYQIDQEYSLHIKGYNMKYSKNPFLSENESKILHQNSIQKINFFLEKYPNNVILHKHTDKGGEDMQTFYNKIGFLLCASIYESFHCAIMEAGSSGCIPIIYEYFKLDTPKTPEMYTLYKFDNEEGIVNFIINIQNYQDKSTKAQIYYNLLNENCLKEFTNFFANIYSEPIIKPYLIATELKSNITDIITLQNKIIEIANKYNNVSLSIFLNKNFYKSNNVTFIKCWKKKYLFGSSSIKIPNSIKNFKIIFRELNKENLDNFNIII